MRPVCGASESINAELGELLEEKRESFGDVSTMFGDGESYLLSISDRFIWLLGYWPRRKILRMEG